jgi:hypothetical protein
MEYTIKEMYEENNSLRIIVDHAYGTDNLGLSLASKKLDPRTDQPRYLSELNHLLLNKYGDNVRRRVDIVDNVGKTFKLEGVNPGIHSWFDELVAIKGIGKINAMQIINLYKSKEELSAAIKNGVKFFFDKNINEILIKIYGV